MVTIATHNGSQARREHNVRNEKVVGKEAHIKQGGWFEIWHDEKPREAYKRLFGEALQNYNAKQTKESRKIRDYFSHIEKDKKKHTVYEMIAGVYPAQGEKLDSRMQRDILRAYVDDWKRRNPALEMIGAYFHADEAGEPHVHLDYVPVAHGYKNGMAVQNGLVKALGEQGFYKQGKDTAQILWERRENQFLEDLCREFGLEVHHPRRESVKHLDVRTYKAQKNLETLEGDVEYASRRKNALEGQIDDLEAILEAVGHTVKQAEARLKVLQGEKENEKRQFEALQEVIRRGQVLMQREIELTQEAEESYSFYTERADAMQRELQDYQQALDVLGEWER